MTTRPATRRGTSFSAGDSCPSGQPAGSSAACRPRGSVRSNCGSCPSSPTMTSRPTSGRATRRRPMSRSAIPEPATRRARKRHDDGGEQNEEGREQREPGAGADVRLRGRGECDESPRRDCAGNAKNRNTRRRNRARKIGAVRRPFCCRGTGRGVSADRSSSCQVCPAQARPWR